MCENYKFGGGKKVFNILLDWQSAVTLSPLAAELWNAPSPPVEYINLSALWNLQIKHRGRRSENENVNLAGSAWGRGGEKKKAVWGSFCFERERRSYTSGLLAPFVTSIIWLLSIKPKQAAARFEQQVCSAVKQFS